MRARTSSSSIYIYENNLSQAQNDAARPNRLLHLPVFMPLLQPCLPDDPGRGAPWVRLPGRITVVIN